MTTVMSADPIRTRGTASTTILKASSVFRASSGIIVGIIVASMALVRAALLILVVILGISAVGEVHFGCICILVEGLWWVLSFVNRYIRSKLVYKSTKIRRGIHKSNSAGWIVSACSNNLII